MQSCVQFWIILRASGCLTTSEKAVGAPRRRLPLPPIQGAQRRRMRANEPKTNTPFLGALHPHTLTQVGEDLHKTPLFPHKAPHTHTHCRLATLGEMQPAQSHADTDKQTPKKIDADMNNMAGYHKVTESRHQDQSHPFRSSMMSKSRSMGTVPLWLWTKPSSAPNRSPSTNTYSVP